MAVFITGGARSGKSDFAERYAMRLAPGGIYIATSQIWDEEMKERVRRHRQLRETSGYPWRTVEEPYDLAGLLRRLDQEMAGGPERPAVLVDCLTLWLTNWMLRLDGESEPVKEEGDAGGRNASADEEEVRHGEERSADESGYDRLRHAHTETAYTQDDRLSGSSDAHSAHSAGSAETTYLPQIEPLSSPVRRTDEGLATVTDELVQAVSAFRGPLLLVSNEVGSGIVPAYPLGRRFRDEAGRLNRRLAAVSSQAFLVVAGFPLDLKKLAFSQEDL